MARKAGRRVGVKLLPIQPKIPLGFFEPPHSFVDQSSSALWSRLWLKALQVTMGIQSDEFEAVAIPPRVSE